jgi:raffinose/stachyose/melibiose transport system substrate-binding protein
MFRTMRKPFSVLVVAAMTFGLVACNAGSSTPSPGASASTGASASSEASASTGASESNAASPSTQDYTGKTLKLWHYESADGAMGKAWTAAIQEFKDTHPGVTVAYENKGFEQIRQTAQMVLNSDQAPDVMELNKGNASAGLLSSQGLLTDLTDVATSRGWDKILSPSVQTTSRYDDKGIMGSGKWYGVTDYGEYVAVFYNKDMFAKYKVQVPTTLAEFEAAMDTFKKASITPIATAGAEYPAQQIVYELALSKADRQWVNDYQLYQNPVDFHGPQLTFGAETFAQWVQKGYVSKTATSMKAEDMGVAFEKGTNPIMISGSWWYGRFMTEIKNFQWGIFLFPGNKLSPGSGGNLWVVPNGAKEKDLAYDFIDITMQQKNQNILANAGGVPVNADLSQITDPKIKDLNQSFSDLLKNDGLAFYPDWPAAGYYDVLVAGSQDLISGSKTPSQYLDAIAGPYKEGKPQ